MIVKEVRRNIPEERENRNDNFRVRYRDKSEFDILRVIITRIKKGEPIVYEFKSSELPDKDSIHFTTKVENDILIVIWKGGIHV